MIPRERANYLIEKYGKNLALEFAKEMLNYIESIKCDNIHEDGMLLWYWNNIKDKIESWNEQQ